MIKNVNSLSETKRKIEGLYKKPVSVTINLGRNKFVVYRGLLDGVYPSLFKVSPFDKAFIGKTTYSYSEYMCGRVKVKEEKKTIS